MQINKVLMPTDFSECANAALAYAIFLARESRAELHWLHAMVLLGDDPKESENSFPDIDLVYRRLGDNASGKMEHLLGKMGVGPLSVHQVQRRAVAVAPAVVDYADEEDVDLIVMGTHGRRGLRRLLLGSVAEEVLRTANCPVLTVRGTDSSKSIEPIQRILVPFDFSDDSESALTAARDLAATFGSHIDLVHVVTPPIAAGPVGMPLSGPVYYDITSDLETSLGRRAAEAADSEVAVESHVLTGVPGQRITQLAEDLGSDLIVIGSHGLTGLRHFLLGSVAERVVRTAECPVLVLRRPAEAAVETEDEGRRQLTDSASWSRPEPLRVECGG